MMLGEKFTAEEALEMGIAYRVVPEEQLMAEASALARRLSRLPARAVADLKRALTRAASQDFEAVLELERDVVYEGFLDPQTLDRVRGASPNR
jgi:enoyl-CoA hydratase/carnithine racemase